MVSLSDRMSFCLFPTWLMVTTEKNYKFTFALIRLHNSDPYGVWNLDIPWQLQLWPVGSKEETEILFPLWLLQHCTPPPTMRWHSLLPDGEAISTCCQWRQGQVGTGLLGPVIKGLVIKEHVHHSIKFERTLTAPTGHTLPDHRGWGS